MTRIDSLHRLAVSPIPTYYTVKMEVVLNSTNIVNE